MTDNTDTNAAFDILTKILGELKKNNIQNTITHYHDNEDNTIRITAHHGDNIVVIQVFNDGSTFTSYFLEHNHTVNTDIVLAQIRDKDFTIYELTGEPRPPIIKKEKPDTRGLVTRILNCVGLRI